MFAHQVEDTGGERLALIPSGALSVKQPLSSSSSSRSSLLGLRGGSRWKGGGGVGGGLEGRSQTDAEELLPLLGIRAEEKKAYHFWGPVPSPKSPPPITRAAAAPSPSATEGSSDTRGRPLLVPTVEGGRKKTTLRMAPNNPL